MKNLDNEMQNIAVQNVLKEMQEAEEILTNWGAFWWEGYEDTVLPQEYFDRFHFDNEGLGEEAKKIQTSTDQYMGVPLRHLMLSDTCGCDVSTIVWSGILTNNASRRIKFHNTGDITLEKDPNKRPTAKHPRTVSYDASYNVLTNDFKIDIALTGPSQSWRTDFEHDDMSIALKGNLVIKKLNGMEIVQDLETGMKLVRITQKYDKRHKENNTSVFFEAALNPDDSLEKGSIVLNTHKGNGKINGTYRFSASRQNGVSAIFTSRKGVKFDLAADHMMLGVSTHLLLPAPINQTTGDKVIASFANSTQDAITKNLSQKEVIFDPRDFDMATVKQADARVMDTIRSIKGELPLPGLTQRVEECLALINKEHDLEINGSSRVRQLESSN